MGRVVEALESTLQIDVLLIRKEYLTLHELITDAGEAAIVVTGQEGIGSLAAF